MIKKDYEKKEINKQQNKQKKEEINGETKLKNIETFIEKFSEFLSHIENK